MASNTPSSRFHLNSNYEARLRSPGDRLRQSPQTSSRSRSRTTNNSNNGNSNNSNNHNNNVTPNRSRNRTPNGLRTPDSARSRGSAPNTPGSTTSSTYSDRYIPSRSGSHLSAGLSPARNHTERSKGNGSAARGSSTGESVSKESFSMYSMLLKNELLGADSPYSSPPVDGKTPPPGNLLRFKAAERTTNPSPHRSFSLSPIISGDQNLLGSPKKFKRKIAKTPFKVLDAPALQDDFYLNLVDWSSLNVLAVGLGSCVYLWSACTSKVTKLCDFGNDDCVTSVSWTQRGTHLAVGTNLGEVQLWDVGKCRLVRTMTGHGSRVGTLAWNSQLLASGSRDRLVFQRDVRVPEQFIRKLSGHKQEVCGLKWSFDDQQLASGGNDNKLLLWNVTSSTPMLRFTDHTAAVKAIAWSPHQNGLLASGGGTADRCIRFWNTLTGTALSCVDTGSQVCNLTWSKTVNEVVSTHGYSLNQIIVWRYPTMTKLVTLTGHTYRVLYLAMSPDGQTIVTGAGDETLRFWNIFPSPKNKDGSRLGTSLLFPSGAEIR